jgi:class 3 adenylate cyclase
MMSHSADVLALSRAGLTTEQIIALSSHMLTTVYFTRFYGIFGTIVLLSASAYAYWRSRSVIAKQRARIVLLGCAVAFFPGVVAMTLAALTRLLIPFNLIPFLMIAFPAAIGYAVARHNLFDVDVYVKRAVGYGVMTAFVGLAYFSMQTLMSAALTAAAFGDAGEKASPVLFALLVVFLFNPVSRRVQEVVDRVFFRKKLDYKETISAVSNALTSMLNLDQIIQRIIRTVRDEMFIDAAGVIVLDANKRSSQSFFVSDRPRSDGNSPEEPSLAYDDPLLSLVREQRRLITKYDIEEDPRYTQIKAVCLQRFSKMVASMAVPLLYQGEVTGVLAVGDKKSGQFYTREDVDLLTTMANQAAVAIQNATAHEEVVRYAAELAASLRRIQILESIKTNLAKFVPKTVQDLIEESPEAPSLEKREADVSVVFADITGYTRLSAQMELEQVNRLVERYFGAFLDEIVKQGGDVNETVGDGLMVIFRDPEPRRHAHAAVLAALGIQRRTREINAELQGQFEPIVMHVGVNSGIASVGATKIEGAAGTRWTYTASGPTTNVAARLAALGEGGAVILSEETRRRLGDEFEAEDLGPQSLKNVANPVRTYKLKPKEEELVAPSVFMERRRHPRRPVSWPVRIWIGDASFEGRALDASVSGICLATIPAELLQVGKPCRLEILTGQDGEFTCVAEIRNLGDRGVGMETSEPLPLPQAVLREGN